MAIWKTVTKGIVRKLGFELVEYSPMSSPTRQIVASLREFKIDLVFDVGANSGQFASGLRGAGYSGNIVSFEPLAEAHSELLRASANDGKWDVPPRCALGDHDGNVEINIAGNSYSSSVLPMLDSHVAAAPESAYVGKELVPLTRFDTVATKLLAGFDNPFLKIDTQGFEWAVLDGAGEMLSDMRGALLELSLIPLYEDQHLWRDIIDRMESHGFALWALQPEFIEPKNGRTLQANGIFYRSD
jgi:FkbM family methyltransferase